MGNVMSYNSFWSWENVVPKEYCDLIIKNIPTNKFEFGLLETKEQADFESRRSNIAWQDALTVPGCILQSFINVANVRAGWNLDHDFIEGVQMTKYESKNKGFYDWHVDCIEPVNGRQRKLSAVLLLNDHSEFEGGDLIFKGHEDTKILNTAGSIVVFPSYAQHMVTPVTAGTRYTAVTWSSGPAFK